MRVVVARPRGFCAGVDRAIEIVELALASYGSPVYVRHAIVHNKHVVHTLEVKGAVFVEEISDIPDDSMVVFSAHGVSPAVWQEIEERNNTGANLEVIDATCPLVTKVHMEVRKYSKDGYEIILVGHRGHVEVLGTSGEAPEHVLLVSTAQDAEQVSVSDPSKVAYVTQTTLSLDDTSEIVDILRKRFSQIQGPKKPDICYATQNRQDAVKELASFCDVIYIVGSEESSNTNRLVETAILCGVPARLVENAEALKDILEKDRPRDNAVIGLSSGASTPETLVNEVIEIFRTLGVERVEELKGVEEIIQFPPPRSLREISKGEKDGE